MMKAEGQTLQRSADAERAYEYQCQGWKCPISAYLWKKICVEWNGKKKKKPKHSWGIDKL